MTKKRLAAGAGILVLLVLLGIALSPPKGPVPGPKGPGTRPSFEVRIPTVQESEVDYTDLLNRARGIRGRARVAIERDIAKRQAALHRSTDEVLHEWE